MRTYEALYIISPELDDNAIQTVVADVEHFIKTHGGSIVRSDIWGRRKLAYAIKKHTEGIYVLLRFTANSDFAKRLEQQMKLTESIIRYLILYLDEKTLKLEAEQQRLYEEDLRLSAERRSRRDDDDEEFDEEEDDEDEDMPYTRRRSRVGSLRRRGDLDDDDEDVNSAAVNGDNEE